MTCIFVQCSKKTVSRGLCSLHWQRENKTGRLADFPRIRNLTDRTHKKCSVCSEMKPLRQFNVVKPKRGGTFLQGRCRSCNLAYCKRWQIENPVKSFRSGRKSHLKNEYGISVEQYEELMIAQLGKCAICKKDCPTGNSLSVDHHHESGKVRGLLCRNCNSALGHAKENIETLRSMIEYLALN